jgi:alpha-1,2-mannosyltransferase
VRVKNAVAIGGSMLMLVVLPVLMTAVCFLVVVTNERYGSDFATFYDSGRAVLHGHSPYPALASLPHAAGKFFAPFVYPPVAAFSMIPLAVLPFPAAAILFFLLNLGAVVLALRLLGVRDWRCYTVTVASLPVYAGLGIGTISPLLLLGVAAAWRYRDRAVAVGLLVAYVMTAKLFLWPIWIWLVRTRRYAAAAIAAGSAGAAILVSWALLGFQGMLDYPRLLARLTELEGPHSYSLYSLARSVGVDAASSQKLVYAATLCAVVAALVFVKGDREWLVAAIGIALLATPILWPHYLMLLFVPVALTQRRFSLVWIAMLALWLDPDGWSWGNPARIAPVLLFVALIVAIGVGGRVRLREEPALLSPLSTS